CSGIIAEPAHVDSVSRRQPCLCSNRTREIGMTRAIGQDYESFLFLLEEATRYATKTLGAT
ncbi:MAG: hypothetical protein ACOYEV_18050, partial [Candidatus Nanopelagicales bacterium]